MAFAYIIVVQYTLLYKIPGTHPHNLQSEQHNNVSNSPLIWQVDIGRQPWIICIARQLTNNSSFCTCKRLIEYSCVQERLSWRVWALKQSITRLAAEVAQNGEGGSENVNQLHIPCSHWVGVQLVVEHAWMHMIMRTHSRINVKMCTSIPCIPVFPWCVEFLFHHVADLVSCF